MAEVTCGKCRFWLVDPPSELTNDPPVTGECHRYSPQGVAEWPRVSRSCFCGEFQEKPAPASEGE